MSQLVTMEFHGAAVSFTEDGWFNATEVAARYGKRPADWFENRETQSYIVALADILNVPKEALLKTKRGRHGSGTWLHPKLAIRFAQWLDTRFAVWCDMQIDALLKGGHPSQDHKRLRHEAASSYKLMGAVLQIARHDAGKAVAPHHFMTEAKLVNWALAHEFKSIDRDSLTVAELDLLAKLEMHNAVMIAAAKSYEERKAALQKYSEQWRHSHAPQLEGV